MAVKMTANMAVRKPAERSVSRVAVRTLVAAAAAATLMAVAPAARAQNVQPCSGTTIDITDDFSSTDFRPPGDDGSYEYTIPTSIFPDGIPFAGGDQTRLWVNINGNLSFEGPEPTFTPDAIPGLNQPTIAPYFTDVDLRDGFGFVSNPGTVTICEDVDNQRILFTWRDVVFYNAALRFSFDGRATFQAILERAEGLCGEGDGMYVTFNYDRLDWYVGDASGGNNGRCSGGAVIPDDCVPAVAGFDGGDGVTAFSVPGSRTATVADTLLALGTDTFELRGGSVPECGDGVVAEACEECDDAGDSETCDADCTFAQCGDEYVNTAAGEECDDGAETELCDDDCTIPECGDGYVNVTAGEACDDGGDSETCNADCTPAVCGDGYVNTAAGENCDDGNIEDGDGCPSDCFVPEADVADEPDAGDTGDVDDDAEADTGADVDASPDVVRDTGVDVEFGFDGRFSGGACNCTSVPGAPTPWGTLALVGLALALVRRR